MDGDQNQGQEVDYDKIMAEQAAKLMAGGGKGPLKKKAPLIHKEKKQFDSADYFKDKDKEHHEGEGGN